MMSCQRICGTDRQTAKAQLGETHYLNRVMGLMFNCAARSRERERNSRQRFCRLFSLHFSRKYTASKLTIVDTTRKGSRARNFGAAASATRRRSYLLCTVKQMGKQVRQYTATMWHFLLTRATQRFGTWWKWRAASGAGWQFAREQ